MDIGQYIGPFLVKNKYCSLPGLGAFELKRQSASLEDNQLNPPKYMVAFSPVGSIDDTFASFIASKENVSISNASNNIKEFCQLVKSETQKTGEFEIENLGRFSLQGGKLSFQQSEDVNLGYEPVKIPEFKVADPPPADVKIDYSYRSKPNKPYYEKSNSLGSIAKIGIPLMLIAMLGAGVYLGYNFFKQKKNNTESSSVGNSANDSTSDTSSSINNETSTNVSNTNSTATTGATDTSAATGVSASDATATNAPPVAVNEYRVVIFTYDNEASANAKAKKLQSFNNKANVIQRGTSYLVTIDASGSSGDTLKIRDSIRAWFNPKGNVYILR